LWAESLGPRRTVSVVHSPQSCYRKTLKPAFRRAVTVFTSLLPCTALRPAHSTAPRRHGARVRPGGPACSCPQRERRGRPLLVSGLFRQASTIYLIWTTINPIHPLSVSAPSQLLLIKTMCIGHPQDPTCNDIPALHASVAMPAHFLFPPSGGPLRAALRAVRSNSGQTAVYINRFI
jgi:hypothetical protein